ncbi:MAG: MFS transporter [Lachnospiraceae bacterium]|nr:MFS transporter [Lachnospiraceae bacterium]
MSEKSINVPGSQKEPIWNWKFIFLILITFFNGVAGNCTVPLVYTYARSFGVGPELASTTAGLMSLVSLVVCPFAGMLADKISRKWILVFANLGYGICLVLHTVCTNIEMLIVMRLLTGIFFSVCSVTNIAFAASFIPKARTGEGLGYISLAQIISQTVGLSIGLIPQDKLPFHTIFLLAGILPFVVIGLLLPLKYVREEPAPDAPKRQKFSLKNLYAPELTLFMLMAALFSAGNGMVSTYLKEIAAVREIARISLFSWIYSAFLIAIRPFTGKLLDRKGVFIILIPSFVFASLGMIFIGLAPSLGMILAAAVFKALGQGNGQPSIQARAVKELPKERSGVASSTVMIGQNVGNAVAPIIGSFFVSDSYYGHRNLFVGFGVILVVGGLLLLFGQWRLEKRKEERGAVNA